MIALNEKIESFHQSEKSSLNTTSVGEKSTFEQLKKGMENLKKENHEMKQHIKYSNI